MDLEPAETDAALLRRSAREPEAFGRFYDRHAEAILTFCVRRTGCAETAADLTGEVFAAAFAKRRSYRDTGVPARAWLYGIARRQIGTFVRRQRVSDRYRRRFGWRPLELGPDDLERVEALADLDAVRGALADATARLPSGQRDAIRLRIVDELPYPEVAARLGCSEGAARVRVSRALARLAEALEAP